MAKRPGQKITMTSIDELLCVPETEGTIDIEVDAIYPVENHPFKVIDDDKMEELVESIRLNGVLTPVLLRPDDEGTYEMISGHRMDIICSGRVKGDLHISGNSTFLKDAQVEGNISTDTMTMEKGALISGSLVMNAGRKKQEQQKGNPQVAKSEPAAKPATPAAPNANKA